MPQIIKSTAFDINGPNEFNKIAGRVECRNPLRPFGHTVDWRIQSAHQNKNHQNKKGKKCSLLLIFSKGAQE